MPLSCSIAFAAFLPCANMSEAITPAISFSTTSSAPFTNLIGGLSCAASSEIISRAAERVPFFAARRSNLPSVLVISGIFSSKLIMSR